MVRKIRRPGERGTRCVGRDGKEEEEEGKVESEGETDRDGK